MANIGMDVYKPGQARAITRQAIKDGELTVPDACEVCGYSFVLYLRASFLVAHHAYGYHKPLEVWFICRSCNRCLEHRHDGSITREQALEIVKSKRGQYWARVEKYGPPDNLKNT